MCLDYFPSLRMRPLRPLALATLLALLTLPVAAQPRAKQYVQAQLSAIASIEPDYADNTDLAAIGQAIGNARLVLASGRQRR